MNKDINIEIKELAKIYKIGKNTLLRILREQGILQEHIVYIGNRKITGYNHNMPYPQYEKYFDRKPFYAENGQLYYSLICKPSSAEIIKNALDKVKGEI